MEVPGLVVKAGCFVSYFHFERDVNAARVVHWYNIINSARLTVEGISNWFTFFCFDFFFPTEPIMNPFFLFLFLLSVLLTITNFLFIHYLQIWLSFIFQLVVIYFISIEWSKICPVQNIQINF